MLNNIVIKVPLMLLGIFQIDVYLGMNSSRIYDDVLIIVSLPIKLLVMQEG